VIHSGAGDFLGVPVRVRYLRNGSGLFVLSLIPV
jgi:hypothetical protein